MTEQSKSWFDRNWKWFVPVICVGAVMILVVSALAIVAGVYVSVKSSGPYRMAVAAAKADPRVTAALGTPIKEGIFFDGKISVNSSTTSGSTGRARFAIPISGPKGKATIYAEAAKSGKKWSFSKLVVHVARTDEEIDLNEQQKKGDRAKLWLVAGQRFVY